MAQTLPAAPSPDTGVTRDMKPNVKVAQFGDGYSQRSSFGQNQIAITVQLSYTFLTSAEKAILEAFVNNHARGEMFFYTLPDEVEARKWFFTNWSFTYVKYGIFNVTLSLSECFDIV